MPNPRPLAVLAGSWLLIFASDASATPPPMEQANANCINPTYASDMLVCETPALKALDDEMASLWLKVADQPMPPCAESQSEWFRRRSLCAMQPGQTECLTAAYQERIAFLRRLATLPDK